MHDDSIQKNKSYLNWGPTIAPLDAVAPPAAADAPAASAGAANWLSF